MISHDGLEKVKRLTKVKDNQIFVVGDNPSASTDSRQFGWLPRAAVIGVLVAPKIPPPKGRQTKQ
jgi:type IV secretory pathway protease TraF